MVSHTPTRTNPAMPVALRRWRTSRWPARRGARWALRGALGVPFVGLWWFCTVRGYVPAANANLALAARTVHWGSSDLRFVRAAFPPVPVALASILPSARHSLGLLGAVLAGVLTHSNLERVRARDNPSWLGWALALGIAATPITAFVATGDLARLLGLLLMAGAMTGLLDFAYNETTEGGFIAGISFGLATTCDLACAGFALAAGLVATLLRPPAGLPPARRRALFVVIVMPTVAFLLAWTYLEWRFTSSPLGSYRLAEPALGRFAAGIDHQFLAALHTIGTALVASPLLVLSALLVARRRVSSGLATGLAVVLVAGVRFVGLTYSLPVCVLFFQLLALIALPERLTRHERLAVVAVSVAQVGLSWHLGLVDPGLHAFRGLF